MVSLNVEESEVKEREMKVRVARITVLTNLKYILGVI